MTNIKKNQKKERGNKMELEISVNIKIPFVSHDDFQQYGSISHKNIKKRSIPFKKTMFPTKNQDMK